ncbi:MAG: glycosyltransferase family 39 protein [Candidatus Daviesbacteria bacterium]|nr:glycosyltransferase family 39 protein [Candidatus Daviesbacteria bacterium]
MKNKSFLLAILAAIIYILLALFTLKDYGISWDETLHFRRGQAYLYYFLTGKTNYNSLPVYNFQGTDGNPANIPIPRRSFYQNDFHNGEFWLENDGGHPPLNDELAAFSNYIFYQKLGILDDISAHHIFNLLASSLLIFTVVYFALITFGKFSGIIAFLSLVTYPLFWSESHFNIKDPPETAFFAAALLAFYKSLDNSSWKWQLTFWLFFTLALGTKFNIFFISLIILPFLIHKYKLKLKNISHFFALPKKFVLLLIIGPILAGIIFMTSWPTLWQNFPEGIYQVFKYYKEVGTGTQYQPDGFFVLGFNFFPILWIIFTTPPIVLILSAIGVVSALINRQRQGGVTMLWLLWFITPILRVMIPGSNIYGGDRQIMEFLPAMCLLSGLGAWQIHELLKTKINKQSFSSNKKLVVVFGLLLFIWPVSVLFKLHPNQNVYFNSLIGGLQGAKERNFPSWGNSFGNAYLQGIKWVNQNAEVGSKLSLIQGTPANVPAILVRSDIDYKNTNWSGIERKGEYLMELYFNDTTKTPAYSWEYVDKFLIPVYNLEVDDVAILKIWKNDLEHTRDQYKISESKYEGNIGLVSRSNELTISLANQVVLSRLELIFIPTDRCSKLIGDYIETSTDGVSYVKEKDRIPSYQIYQKLNMIDNTINFYFAGKNAKYIRVHINNDYSCMFNVKSPSIYELR